MTSHRLDAPLAEWDADTYLRLGRPQLAWGRPVMDTIPLRGDETVVDAGCGTGRLALELAERVPSGFVAGVDRSANMLAVARAHLPASVAHRVRLVQADLLALPLAGRVDVIFSTAAFHWVLDHDRLFAELYRALRPGGWLVAQCGGGPNLARLLGRVARLTRAEPYRRHLDGWPGPWRFADAATTQRRLSMAGFVEVDTAVIEAPTVLSGRQEYIEFLAAVVLRAHLDRLQDPDLGAALLTALADRAEADDPPFSLDYRRLNLRGRRPPGVATTARLRGG